MRTIKLLNVFFKKLHERAIAPLSPTYEENAGYDLSCIEYVEIPPGERRLVKTGLAMEIPAGFYGHISDRSGNAWKKGVHCLGKIIDPSYRGEIGVILYNTSTTEPAIFHPGNRIAQIIIKKYEKVKFIEVNELMDSNRGEGGFGSTGE